MKQRTKNYLLATIVAVMIGAGLTVSCASQKLSVTQNNAEIVPSVNAKPEVVWSEDPAENKFYENKTFLIPDEYFVQKPSGNYDSLQTIVLSMPDLKPLPSLKRRCRMGMPNLKCLQGVLEVQFGHDLNRQVFKDKGINEDNYLNRFTPPAERAKSVNWKYYIKSNSVYDFDEVYLLDVDKALKEDEYQHFRTRTDDYFKYDSKGNVQTHVKCRPNAIANGYIYKNEVLQATCTQVFIIKAYKMEVGVEYERQYLPQWQKIQTAVINLINQLNQNANTKQGDK